MINKGVVALLRERQNAALRMRKHSEKWDAFGLDPLPHGIDVLNKLRGALDEVRVIEDLLKQRFEAGADRGVRTQAPSDLVATRRRLFADLRRGRLDLAELHPCATEDTWDAEQVQLLQYTHAFAIVRAQYGHCRALQAFEALNVNLDATWHNVVPKLSALQHALTGDSEISEAWTETKAAAVDADMTKQAARAEALRQQVVGPDLA